MKRICASALRWLLPLLATLLNAAPALAADPEPKTVYRCPGNPVLYTDALSAKDHDHMVSMLRDHKDDLKSPELKQLVDNTIPVLEQHKDMAEKAGRNTPHPQGRSPTPEKR